MNAIFISFLLVLFQQTLMAQTEIPSPVREGNEAIAPGIYNPTWESLSLYQAPEWFQNAKFGIWAHWGPQCQPEQGDWYARFMYDEGSKQYKWHVENYGHPSVFGFKDVIHEWKAENWNPDSLVVLYKRCGAQYFFAMANHHDNFDMWNSKYQPWNSVNMGPKKDIIAGWAKAAHNNKLPFGISVHAAHAWTWFETAQRSDTTGPYAGVPYDGKLTKADSKGLWWEGYDPQDLYAQNHTLSEASQKTSTIHSQWNWGNGASIPSQEYCDKFYNRTIDLINQYHPDLLYFDDTALPLWPVSDAGLKIAAHFYNSNMALHNGKNEAVLFGKILTDEQKKCLVWDVEKGAPDQIQQLPWQTCTCIGGWHYEKWRGEGGKYKSASEVIRMLIDVVSKNGNLLLNIPVKGDGSIDQYEKAILEQIAAWMDNNKESIFGTRPWKIFGEGPVADEANPLKAQGFNEGVIKKLTARDIRFTQNGNIIYASVMGVPSEEISIKNLGKEVYGLNIDKIELLGSNKKVNWEQNAENLTIEKPQNNPNDIAIVFKIHFK